MEIRTKKCVGTTEPRGDGAMGQRNDVATEQRGNRTTERRNDVATERRNDGTTERRKHVATERRNDAATERRSDGTTERRNDRTSSPTPAPQRNRPRSTSLNVCWEILKPPSRRSGGDTSDEGTASTQPPSRRGAEGGMTMMRADSGD